ncbi:hypothetical protein LMH73_013135 [Vibrio splendidus]|nr:hypothetical protein [Vibrio splendidus]MCC4880712.1 hypothetical protein [Vibrio splendidus]
MKLNFVFINAGIRFFSVTKEDGKQSTLAIMRDQETKKLMCVHVRNIKSKATLNERGLRCLKALSEKYKKPIEEFRYEDYGFTPSFSAKRELSALQLNLSLPSISAIPDYLSNLDQWTKKRVSRSLDVDDIGKIASILSAIGSKTPRELMTNEYYEQMHLVSSRINDWIHNRKKYKLRIKEMKGMARCIDRHIEVLYSH